MDNETLDLNIDDLFKDEEPEENINAQDETKETSDGLDLTKTMSERINTVKRKTKTETQDEVAKELGYENYAALQKAKEEKLIKEAGYDSEDIKKLLNDLVEERYKNDPRLKRLEEYEERDKKAFVTNQLKAINTLAGTNYTDISELPKETLEIWEKTGDLKKAYLATEGEKLLSASRQTKQNIGSTSHLANPGSAGLSRKVRLLTEDEKAIYRSVLGDAITEEELNKRTIEID